MNIKFNTAYTIGKEELPFTKFPVMLKMLGKNGLVINHNYENDVKCAEMIICISDTLKSNISDKLKKSSFYSIMINAGTDSGIKENEAVVIRYVFEGVAETKLLGLVELNHATAEGM